LEGPSAFNLKGWRLPHSDNCFDAVSAHPVKPPDERHELVAQHGDVLVN
jgi:hypothetical protein